MIKQQASPTEKLQNLYVHLCNPRFSSQGIGGSGKTLGFELANCCIDLNYREFGLRSYRELTFYLDSLIERGLIEVVGNEVLEREEFHCKVKFPRKVRVRQVLKSLEKPISLQLEECL